MAKRIDNLNPGELVTLRFHGSRSLGNDAYDEQFKFVGIEGVGDDRRAGFTDAHSDLDSTAWQAYRFRGRWVYGSSAEKLSIAV